MISDALMSSLNDFVSSKMGLCFPEDKRKDLESAILEAYGELGFKDAESCIKRLISCEPTRKQIEILANHLTIGETYFFRDKEVFCTLEQHVLPDLIFSRKKSRYLRIWSAGCSSGEEAYSVAMLLSRMLPDISDWNITILATDINYILLEKGRKGVYTNWSFRSTPESIYMYFKQTREGFEIKEYLKKMITFNYLNLAEDIYPSVLNNTNAMDIILCRNVLMYFKPDAAKKVLERLYLCLVDGGLLAITPAEASHFITPKFTKINLYETILYKKEKEMAVRPVSAHIKITAPPVDAPLFVPSVTPSVLAVKEKKSGAFDEALILANQGKLDEARAICKKAIDCDKLNPLSHYLNAIISQELGDKRTAIASFRRAIYLDKDFILAYFSLGNLLDREGKTLEAKKCFDNTLLLLSKLTPNEALPASEGITAGRLSQIVNSLKVKP